MQQQAYLLPLSLHFSALFLKYEKILNVQGKIFPVLLSAVEKIFLASLWFGNVYLLVRQLPCTAKVQTSYAGYKKISTGKTGSKVTSRPHYDTKRAAGKLCIEPAEPGMKNVVPCIGFLYWAVWHLSNQQIYFSVNGPFVHSWLGQFLFLFFKKIYRRGKKLYPASHCRGKNVPCTCLPGKKIVPGTKIHYKLYTAVMPIVPGFDSFRYYFVFIQTRRVERGHWPEKSYHREISREMAPPWKLS